MSMSFPNHAASSCSEWRSAGSVWRAGGSGSKRTPEPAGVDAPPVELVGWAPPTEKPMVGDAHPTQLSIGRQAALTPALSRRERERRQLRRVRAAGGRLAETGEAKVGRQEQFRQFRRGKQ